jgi:sec-independent protein translocase protein TatA
MLHPVFAIIDAPIIIGILVVGAILFGADKLPKLARSAGQAKKEFMMGQIEADEATAKAREEARARLDAQSTEQPAGTTSDKSSPTP